MPAPGTMPVSILDRSHLTAGSTAGEALRRTIDRARHAEQRGFARFWVSEHHGVPGVAGASTAVLLAAIGQVTRRIRLGSGGVMVPNHQPLVTVEQFGILDALYPGRIDLGLGRSLGFVRPVRRALRRETYSLEEYADDIHELLTLLADDTDVLASPGAAAAIEVFILAAAGSADLAARFGLPLVAGGPRVLEPGDDGLTTIDRYRRDFRPSAHATDPHVIFNANVLLADDPDVAAGLALPEAWAHVNSRREGAFLPLESPDAVRAMDVDERQQRRLAQMTATTLAGTPAAVKPRLDDLLTQSQADELLVSGAFFDHEAALRSDALLAEMFRLGRS